MNNAINKIKVFFKSKPVRIVVALIIIAAVMTGVGFGVIALVNALKAPCKSGYQYDKDLKVCVKDGCKNICKADVGTHKKGDCMPDNYCDHSGAEGQYKFDSNTCECTLVCNGTDKKPFNTKFPNKTTTPMYKKSNEWYPVNKLKCGYECNLSKNKYCDEPNKCNISLNKNGYLMSEGTACYNNFNDNDYEKCDDRRVICRHSAKKGSKETYKCSNGEVTAKEAHYLNGLKFQSYCASTSKCGKFNHDQQIICASNSDCEPRKLYNNTTNTQNDSDVECIPHSILEGKGINNLGVCRNSIKFSDQDDYCIDVNKVGENIYKSDAELSNLLYKVTPYEDSVGISLNQPQCIDPKNGAKCKTSDIEGWYCGNINDASIVHGSDLGSLSVKKPPIYSQKETVNQWKNDDNELMCCGKQKVVQSKYNTNYCCPKNVKSNKCRNTSEFPPDESWLEISNNNFSCSEDTHCEKYNSQLENKLMFSGCKLNKIKDENHSCYSKMFCDKKNSQCKFYAGFIDKLDSTGEFSFNKYIIGEDPKKSKSIALSTSGSDPIIWTYPELEEGNPANFFMCHQPATSGEIFGKYSNYEPVPPSRTTQYGSKIILNGTSSKDINDLVANTSCIKQARRKGIYDTSVINKNKASLGEVSTTENSNNITCKMSANCNNSASTVKTDSLGDSSTGLKWNFGPRDYPINGVYDSTNPTANQIYLTAGETDSGTTYYNCRNRDNKSLCEHTYTKVPHSWSTKEKSFGSLCKWNNDKGYCTSACDVLLKDRPKYNLITGEYSDTGFGRSNLFGSQQKPQKCSK